ncbi:unnamed protein product, partial [Pylaiella littoralis]
GHTWRERTWPSSGKWGVLANEMAPDLGRFGSLKKRGTRLWPQKHRVYSTRFWPIYSFYLLRWWCCAQNESSSLDPILLTFLNCGSQPIAMEILHALRRGCRPILFSHVKGYS